MSIPHQSAATGLENLPCLKYNVLKLKNNLKINFFKNTLLFHIRIKFFQNLKKN